MKIHEKYIQRCIEIGKNGLGETAPNPMVGCVIVYNNSIIGEGFTSSYGGNHAEVNAIHSIEDKSLLKTATLYVTLEPCSHFGKTPPCSDLIIKYEIPKVVIGCVDDNPSVAGQGIKRLRKNGCEVIVGILKEKCKEHHKRFFTYHNKKRPYIILKWAQTKDGFIAPNKKQHKRPVWITNPFTQQIVHKWRSEEQAILVGAKTVIEDNPNLTTRNFNGKNPLRIVVEKNKLSRNFTVFDNSAKTLVIGKNQIDYQKPIAKQICKILYTNKINSVIVEGGSRTLQHFINEDLWDEARVLIGKTTFQNGVKSPDLMTVCASEHPIKNDILKIYFND